MSTPHTCTHTFRKIKEATPSRIIFENEWQKTTGLEARIAATAGEKTQLGDKSRMALKSDDIDIYMYIYI